jgi:hypothetical protein
MAAEGEPVCAVVSWTLPNLPPTDPNKPRGG